MSSSVLGSHVPLFPLVPYGCSCCVYIVFVISVSFVSILQLVAQRCQLPFVSTVREVIDDGTILYGVEFELPSLFAFDSPRRLFFWSSLDTDCSTPYENAAFQAVSCLQSLYGFSVLDYNYQTMVRQREFLRQLFSFANRGAQLARMVITASQYGIPLEAGVLQGAEQLLQDIDCITNPPSL